MTGKIDREVRSGGVSIVLGGQKLRQQDLDKIGGLGTLKDLALDQRLPVPVSEKFPSGWAHNAELAVGDLLYAADGTQVPIIGFSEVFTDSQMFRIVFEDGSTVEAGGHHQWLASSFVDRERTRRSDPANNPNAAYRMCAEHAFDLAAAFPAGAHLTVDEIARMLGVHPRTITRIAKDTGITPVVRG